MHPNKQVSTVQPSPDRRRVGRVLIIVPVLNEAEGIDALLDQLLPLTGDDCALVVVDGGSADHTRALAQRRLQPHQLICHDKPGRAYQMQAGLAAAEAGDVLWFVHADTRLDQLALSALREAVAAGSLWGRFDVRLSGRRSIFLVIGWMMNWRSAISGICTGDQGIFVTHTALQEVGGVPPLALMEDVALSARLKRRFGYGARIRKPLLVTSSRKWERGGVFRTIVLMWFLRLAYFLGLSDQRIARLYYPNTQRKLPYRVQVFSKVPVQNRVKTRLHEVLGPPLATQMYKALLRQACRTAKAVDADAELWFDRAPDERAQHYGIEKIRIQQGGDLGARMQHAAKTALGEGVASLIMGSDCPMLIPDVLHAAIAALAAHEVVLVPAEDGGYALIAMRVMPAAVFVDVPWGTDAVLGITTKRLTQSKVSYALLPMVRDIDRPDDLAHFLQSPQAPEVLGEELFNQCCERRP